MPTIKIDMHDLSPLWVIPFVLLLVAIAICPLIIPRFWEHNRVKGLISIVICTPTAIFLYLHGRHYLLESLHEYVSFICLLASLFIVSGGIEIKGEFKGTPRQNVCLLAIGSVLANIIGTTGASMLLIRPLLKANKPRTRSKHIPLFFIFMVSNIGGLLTPIGDPPLFLGFLRGVPFFWTFKLFPIWAFLIGSLLTIFYILDVRALRLDLKERPIPRNPENLNIQIKGVLNILLLMGVVAAVFLPSPFREGIMIAIALISIKFTPREIREANAFNFHPISEVALLFIGIFITMVPVLLLLKASGPSLGVHTPNQFFWITGMLSGFLDNAPTYLTFFSLGQGLNAAHATVAGLTAAHLKAISAGAVLMGSLTYIGNGPNFMVKAIADDNNYPKTTFFEYMFYSFTILIPLFMAVSLLFIG